MNETEKLLAERATTHGEYTEHARLTQSIMEICRSSRNWQRKKLSNMQRESLHMIAHKIGRILEGDPNHADHWDDIAGYARLVSQRLAPEPQPKSTMRTITWSELTRRVMKAGGSFHLNGDWRIVPDEGHIEVDTKTKIPVHAVGDAATRSGANGMTYGDRVIYQPTKIMQGRRGVAGEFTQDGDVEIDFDDGQVETVKWAKCYKEDARPVPVEDSNRHADRAGGGELTPAKRRRLTRWEYLNTIVEEEKAHYRWDDQIREFVPK